MKFLNSRWNFRIRLIEVMRSEYGSIYQFRNAIVATEYANITLML